MSSTVLAVALTTFLASAVEAIEMVAIVGGVAATRGWRPAVAGADPDPDQQADEDIPRDQPDWTGFVLSFKGVLLEGLEVAFIAVTFGTTSNQLGVAVAAAVLAVAVIGALGAAIQPVVARIPRSVLQLVVGLLLTTFGTFWSIEGLNVEWPGSDLAILGLLAWYVAIAAVAIAILRGRGPTRRQAAAS